MKNLDFVFWIKSPVRFGLLIYSAFLTYQLGKEIYHIGFNLTTVTESDLVIASLSALDIYLIVCMMVAIVFEDLSAEKMKLKLMSAMITISGVKILQDFMHLDNGTLDEKRLIFSLIIHFAFLATFAVFYKLNKSKE